MLCQIMKNLSVHDVRNSVKAIRNVILPIIKMKDKDDDKEFDKEITWIFLDPLFCYH